MRSVRLFASFSVALLLAVLGCAPFRSAESESTVAEEREVALDNSSIEDASLPTLLRIGHDLATSGEEFLTVAQRTGLYELIISGELGDWTIAGNTPLTEEEFLEHKGEWGEYVIVVGKTRYFYFATDRHIPVEELAAMLRNQQSPQWRVLFVVVGDWDIGEWRQEAIDSGDSDGAMLSNVEIPWPVGPLPARYEAYQTALQSIFEDSVMRPDTVTEARVGSELGQPDLVVEMSDGSLLVYRPGPAAVAIFHLDASGDVVRCSMNSLAAFEDQLRDSIREGKARFGGQAAD